MPKKLIAVILLLVLVAISVVFYEHHKNTSSNSNGIEPGSTSSVFNKSQYSLTDPTSIWVIVNKKHQLNPKDYAPKDLVFPTVPLRVPGNESMQVRSTTAKALENMFAGAKKQGINLMLSSGYRSYIYQVNLYNGYVQSEGQKTADTQSARPGYSEHQTGLAADIEPLSRKCELAQCFNKTPEGKWLAVNAYKYGFIIRYPKGYESTTGYEYEPWHVRYIGITLSNEMHKEHIATLEQFFNVPGGNYQ